MSILLLSGPLIKDNDILYGVLSVGDGDCRNVSDPQSFVRNGKQAGYTDVRDRWIAENLLIAKVPDILVLGISFSCNIYIYIYIYNIKTIALNDS